MPARCSASRADTRSSRTMLRSESRISVFSSDSSAASRAALEGEARLAGEGRGDGRVLEQVGVVLAARFHTRAGGEHLVVLLAQLFFRDAELFHGDVEQRLQLGNLGVLGRRETGGAMLRIHAVGRERVG